MAFRLFSFRLGGAEPVTAESILAAAATVLAAQGQAGFNASSVAKAAGVSLATFRRHFADTTELLREMIERDARQRAQLGLRLLSGLGAAADLSQIDIASLVHGYIALMIASRRRDPVSVLLRELARTTPGLMSVDDGWHADWIPPFASFLLRNNPALSPPRAAIAARFVATLHVFVIDFALAHPELEAAILAEWEPLLVGYFTRLRQAGPDGESETGSPP